eukprot:364816-Rhodomonas_salina.1
MLNPQLIPMKVCQSDPDSMHIGIPTGSGNQGARGGSPPPASRPRTRHSIAPGSVLKSLSFIPVLPSGTVRSPVQTCPYKIPATLGTGTPGYPGTRILPAIFTVAINLAFTTRLAGVPKGKTLFFFSSFGRPQSRTNVPLQNSSYLRYRLPYLSAAPFPFLSAFELEVHTRVTKYAYHKYAYSKRGR